MSLYNGNQVNRPVLAALRNSKTLDDKQAQKLWPYIFSELDKESLSVTGKVTWEEKAVYTALRLYALHQQGKEELVYEKEHYLFTELGVLRKDESLRVALDRRVQAILATNSVEAVINGLTQIVQITKNKDARIKIDYPTLAANLLYFQSSSSAANSVRLSWGRQYYRIHFESKN